MSRQRAARWVLWSSLALALLLGLFPLPLGLTVLRPFWLALVIIYWTLEAPDQIGLGIAFLIGLLADLVYGTLFGEHALRLCIIAFLVLRFRARLRFFPLSQQALAVLLLLLNDRVVVMAIRVASGEGVPDLLFWITPLVGTLLWPWLFLLIDQLRLRARHRDG